MPRPICLSYIALSMSILVTSVGAQENNNAVQHAKALSRAFRQAAEKATPSVVTIVAQVKTPQIAENGDLLKDPPSRDVVPEGDTLFDPSQNATPEEESERGFEYQIGSGVVIDAAGIILTNNHVVREAQKVVVRLADGREFKAENIKTDPLSDLAVLKIQGAGVLKAAVLGDSAKLEIGDWVIAIGSPFELEATVSAGIISGKGRSIRQIHRGKLLQTDTAINPGNSGGPLVNLDGQVVGINTAIATSNGGYQGIGFAIPINRAQWVAAQLLEHGAVRRAYLGVRIDDIAAATSKRLGVPVRGGALIVDVFPGSPASEAGMGHRRRDYGSRRTASTEHTRPARYRRAKASGQAIIADGAAQR